MSQGAGTLGLVNDLSVKLAKQRKQLNGLVKDVKSAGAAEMRWYHYAGVIVLNNLAVMLLGVTVSSMLMGIGSDGGALMATQITATGLTVRAAAATDMVIQSSNGGATASVGASGTTSVGWAVGGSSSRAFGFESAGPEKLLLLQGNRRIPDFSIRPGITNNVTDVCFSPNENRGSVFVSNTLELTGNSIVTHNVSLTLRTGIATDGQPNDLVFAPTDGGRVDIQGPLDLSGNLKVSIPGEKVQFHASPIDNTLSIGLSAAEGSTLAVHGAVNLTAPGCYSNCHRLEGGNLNILEGNMILGKADIVTAGKSLRPHMASPIHAYVCGQSFLHCVPPAGDLSVAGDVNFGSFSNNTLEGELTTARAPL